MRLNRICEASDTIVNPTGAFLNLRCSGLNHESSCKSRREMPRLTLTQAVSREKPHPVKGWDPCSCSSASGFAVQC